MTICKKLLSLLFFILLISTCTNAQNNGYYENNHKGKIENNNSSQDTKRAMHFKLEAEKGDATSQCNYGICLLNGKGVNKNLKEAAYWFKKSAEQGNAKGQLNYGVCLLKGIGTEKNDKGAAYWFKKSAEQGNVKAQELYSSLFQNIAKSEKKNNITEKKSTETLASKDISNTIDTETKNNITEKKSTETLASKDLPNTIDTGKKNNITEKKSTETLAGKDISNTINTETKNESTNSDDIEEVKLKYKEMNDCYSNMLDLRNAIQFWNHYADRSDSSKERMDDSFNIDELYKSECLSRKLRETNPKCEYYIDGTEFGDKDRKIMACKYHGDINTLGKEKNKLLDKIADFQRAEAIKKSNQKKEMLNKCISISNQIKQGVESYNKANPTNPMSSLNINKLVEAGYLSSNPKGPEENCQYSSSGDLTQKGEIVCLVHGTPTIIQANACIKNIKSIALAIQMYNLSEREPFITNFDINKLVKGKYLVESPDKPTPSCEYVLDNNQIVCKYHGNVAKIEQLIQNKSNELGMKPDNKKICIMNIRKITAAVEMYNFDHTEMMTKLELGKLIKSGYIKTVPKGPESECEYMSVGNLSDNGHIECKKHGKWDGELF